MYIAGFLVIIRQSNCMWMGCSRKLWSSPRLCPRYRYDTNWNASAV